MIWVGLTGSFFILISFFFFFWMVVFSLVLYTYGFYVTVFCIRSFCDFMR